MPHHNHTSESHRTLESLHATARRVLPDGGEAWLFGSQARGTAGPDSDWDVLILLDKDLITGDDHDRVAYPFRECGWDFNACINPIILTKKAWAESWFTPFYKNVMQDRIAL